MSRRFYRAFYAHPNNSASAFDSFDIFCFASHRAKCRILMSQFRRELDD